MAKNGTYNSVVSPNGPSGTMVVGGTSGNVTVTYAGTSCTVNQNASQGDALSFTYTTGGQTYDFNGACPNDQYRGTCEPSLTGTDNWTATATTQKATKHSSAA